MEINVLSSWLCQSSCLFLQAQVKSKVLMEEHLQDSSGDLGESLWSAPTSDQCHPESFDKSFGAGRGRGMRGLVKEDTNSTFNLKSL